MTYTIEQMKTMNREMLYSIIIELSSNGSSVLKRELLYHSSPLGDSWELKVDKKMPSGKVKVFSDLVDRVIVLKLWNILKSHSKIGKDGRKKTTYRDVIWDMIRDVPDENVIKLVTIDAVNGGKNRAKIYFPLYYDPLKVLEALGAVSIKGRNIYVNDSFKVPSRRI